MNTRLLRKVQKHILAEPRRLDMESLCYKYEPEEGGPPCGTVGCIAGWAHMLTMPKFPVTEVQFDKADNDAWDAAQEQLRLTDEQTYLLFSEPDLTDYGPDNDPEDDFYVPCWPEKLAKRYLNAKTAKDRAKVTSDRIDLFITSKGTK